MAASFSTNTNSRNPSQLPDYSVKYFDGVDSNGIFQRPEFLILEQNGQSAIPEFVVNDSSTSRLNPEVEGRSFVPLHQIFRSNQALVSGVFIPAVDGVYWNSLESDEDKLSNWSKIESPTGSESEPFVDWIVDNGSNGLHGIKTSTDRVNVFKNELIVSSSFTRNTSDQFGASEIVFHDLDNSENSLIITEDNDVLNSDRTRCDDAGNIASIGANGISKLGNTFYAFADSNGIGSNYKTTENPKTGVWTQTSEYDPFSKYCAGPSDFLIKSTGPESHLKYNAFQRNSLWASLSAVPMLWDTETHAVISVMSNDFKYSSVFDADENIAGFAKLNDESSIWPRERNETYEMQLIPDGHGGVSQEMVKWMIDVDGNVYSFDLRGTVRANGKLYAIGNAYNDINPPFGVVLAVPSNRPSVRVDNGDGTSFNKFEFDESMVDIFTDDVVNGPAVELSAVSDSSESTIVKIFTAIPLLSEDNSEIVIIFHKNDYNGDYAWDDDYDIVPFDYSEIASDPGLTIGDIVLFDNYRIYTTVYSYPALDQLSVFATNVTFNSDDSIEINDPFSIDSIDRSVFNVVKDYSTNNALIDFGCYEMRFIAHASNPETFSLLSVKFQDTPSTYPSTPFDYAILYGASNLSADAKEVLKYCISEIEDFQSLQCDSQLRLSDARTAGISSILDISFNGTLNKRVFSDIEFNGCNSIVASFMPKTTTVTSHDSQVIEGEVVPIQPTTFPFNESKFGIMSLRSTASMSGIYVGYVSNAVTRDGYFYATVYDITEIRYDDTPIQIDSNTWEWTASPVLGDKRYVLLKLNDSSATITEVKSIAKRSDDGFSNAITGPDSWAFLTTAEKIPNILAFENWSLKKYSIESFSIDNWADVGSISVSGSSGKYVHSGDGKVLTWNASKKVFLLDLNNLTSTTFDGSSKFTGNIFALQLVNNETVYVFTIASTRSEEISTVRIYSGSYASFGSSWNPTLMAQVPNIDLLANGSVYLATTVNEYDESIMMLVYSSSHGGIKTIKAKIIYSIISDVFEKIKNTPVDGNVLKDIGHGILATGSNKLSSLVRNYDDLGISEIGSNLGSLHNVFLNYATQYTSSYTLTSALTSSDYRPRILETSESAYSLKDISYDHPPVYDVSVEPNRSSYRYVNFLSYRGTIYQLSSISYTPTGTESHEVYNGPSLVSGMIYGFPPKDTPASAMNDYKGTIEEMHIAAFDVDLSGLEKNVFIDNLYNTLKLTDEFEQTYWLAIAQLDNRVSSLIEDDKIHWTHYPQRYRMCELYDEPFRFTDVRNPGTTSVETILTSQDNLVVYRALPRADWDTTHLRKILREQAHLDNACEVLELNPEQTNLFKDIQTSPDTGALLLDDGHAVVFHSNWRHDIKYFGTCIQPYTMFNSRIQDTYVTTISKYGNDDLNFVLGTSQGFLHLINGHLLAMAMYTDLDDVTHLLSGACTYAGSHSIDNGTSIENRFLFTNEKSLFNVAEHSFDAKCEINDTFIKTRERINDIFRIGDGAYAICTDKGIYSSRPRVIIKDYLDDYMLSDLNNAVDIAFSRLLSEHVKARHFTGSDMDVINHKIDRNFNPYPAGFTSTSPVITSRHVLDVDNDLVESMEVRLTDDQANNNASNIFAAVKNEVLFNVSTATRTYAPTGWFDRVVDINDPNHIVDYSDIRYICRRWRSGVVEFYIYIPTTFTYYFNNLASYSQSPYAGLALVRPNAGNFQIENSLNRLCTTLRLFISNLTYKLNTIYMIQIVGNSLPLKIYMDSTYCDLNRAGLFDTLIQPSVVKALPAMVGRSKNNVNPLMNASEQICLDFSIYGTDAQAIHILAR